METESLLLHSQQSAACPSLVPD